MKTVVIFGGSGFIGQNIIRRLAKQGLNVIVPYQKPIKEAKLRLYGNLGQIIPLRYKSLYQDKIKEIIDSADMVINLKTIWQEKKGYSYKKHILNFNVQLIDLINRANKNKVFIFFSGLGVNETTLSKRVQYISKVENYIHENVNKAIIIKPSIVIGIGDQFIGKLLSIFKLSFFIPLFGSGEAKLQPVFVDDVAKAIENILKQKIKCSNIYELAGPEIFTYTGFYQFLADCLGLRRKFIPIPFRLALLVVSILEKTPINIITKDQLLLFRQDNISTNLNKDFKSLGILPKNIREIIKKIIY